MWNYVHSPRKLTSLHLFPPYFKNLVITIHLQNDDHVLKKRIIICWSDTSTTWVVSPSLLMWLTFGVVFSDLRLGRGKSLVQIYLGKCILAVKQTSAQWAFLNPPSTSSPYLLRFDVHTEGSPQTLSLHRCSVQIQALFQQPVKMCCAQTKINI